MENRLSKEYLQIKIREAIQDAEKYDNLLEDLKTIKGDILRMAGIYKVITDKEAMELIRPIEERIEALEDKTYLE